MAIINQSKPTTSLTNSTKVSFAETWGTIDTTWATETQSWADLISLFDNASKPVPGYTNMFTSFPTTATRNNFTGTLGFRFTVSSTIYVFEIGRLFVSGNIFNHKVNVWISTDTATPIATATILSSSASDSNNFKYVALTSPLELTAGNTYYVGIDNYNTLDTFKDVWSLSGTTQSVFTIGAAVYSTSVSTFPSSVGNGGSSYDTPTFKYSTLLSGSIISNIAKP